MNKKIICLLLSVLMLLSVCLTACGEVSDEENIENIEAEASASAVTLVMYLMAENSVSEEQELLMEDAVNAITQDKFTTKIDLVYLTPDEYYGKLEENLAEQAKKADIYFVDEEADTTAAETDDYNIELVHYPDVKPNQVDIFYFGGYDKYTQYMNDGSLALLSENVDGASKALKSYVTPQLIEQMKKVNDGIYAVPTNRAIGDYTYLLLNKTVLAQTRYDPEYWDFTSLTCENVQDLLSLVASEASLKDTFVPVYSMTGELDIIDYQYWGVDENGFLSNDFSILGGYYDKTLKYGELDSFTPINRVFSDDYFLDQLRVLNDYHVAGYYDDEAVEAGEKPFAVGYVKGGQEDVAKYAKDYEIVTVGKPMIYTGDLYESMFGVSAYSVSLARSMEIITFLNTDKDFRNLMQYGIEDVNYTLVPSGVKDVNDTEYMQVKILTGDDYVIDPMKMGNVLLTYPTVDQNPLVYEYAKVQNREISVSLSMGFRLDYSPDYIIHAERFQTLRTTSEEALAKLVTMMNENPEDTFTAIEEEGVIVDYKFNDTILKLQNSVAIAFMQAEQQADDKTTGEKLSSFGLIYYEWLVEKGMYVRPEEDEDEMGM